MAGCGSEQSATATGDQQSQSRNRFGGTKVHTIKPCFIRESPAKVKSFG
jgi:hypothetical protein